MCCENNWHHGINSRHRILIAISQRRGSINNILDQDYRATLTLSWAGLHQGTHECENLGYNRAGKSCSSSPCSRYSVQLHSPLLLRVTVLLINMSSPTAWPTQGNLPPLEFINASAIQNVTLLSAGLMGAYHDVASDMSAVFFATSLNLYLFPSGRFLPNHQCFESCLDLVDVYILCYDSAC